MRATSYGLTWNQLAAAYAGLALLWAGCGDSSTGEVFQKPDADGTGVETVCDEVGKKRCDSSSVVICSDGVWQVHTQCEAWGADCYLIDGVAQCVPAYGAADASEALDASHGPDWKPGDAGPTGSDAGPYDGAGDAVEDDLPCICRLPSGKCTCDPDAGWLLLDSFGELAPTMYASVGQLLVMRHAPTGETALRLFRLDWADVPFVPRPEDNAAEVYMTYLNALQQLPQVPSGDAMQVENTFDAIGMTVADVCDEDTCVCQWSFENWQRGYRLAVFESGGLEQTWLLIPPRPGVGIGIGLDGEISLEVDLGPWTPSGASVTLYGADAVQLAASPVKLLACGPALALATVWTLPPLADAVANDEGLAAKLAVASVFDVLDVVFLVAKLVPGGESVGACVDSCAGQLLTETLECAVDAAADIVDGDLQQLARVAGDCLSDVVWDHACLFACVGPAAEGVVKDVAEAVTVVLKGIDVLDAADALVDACFMAAAGFYYETELPTSLFECTAADPCADVTCPPCHKCSAGECQADPSQNAMATGCEGGKVCANGSCSSCGNLACEGSEDCSSCPKDCGCGYGTVCASGECTSCGNATCDEDESCASCAGDCGCAGNAVCIDAACTTCGNGSCDSGENCASCQVDCSCPTGAACSNGTCTSCGNGSCDAGESCVSCPDDCGCVGGAVCLDGACTSCGNANCDAGESCASCPADCACTGGAVCLGGVCTKCGNGSCDPTENCASCPADCGCAGGAVCLNGACTTCGNGSCDSDESCSSCLVDCGCVGGAVCLAGTCTTCGNGNCDAGESCDSCDLDCGCAGSAVCMNGACTMCGNSNCDAGESCSNCEADCACTGGTVCISATCTSCGNGTCDAGEACDSCPQDCACAGGKICEQGACVTCPPTDGAPACPYDPVGNNSASWVGQFPDRTDSDYISDTLCGYISATSDQDWIPVWALDTVQGSYEVNVTLTPPANADLDLCVYFSPDAGYAPTFNCILGYPQTMNGMAGCCSSYGTGEPEEVRFNVETGLVDDNSGTVWMRTMQGNGAPSCGQYQLEFDF